jgi:alanyl-tRNA synthetase
MGSYFGELVQQKAFVDRTVVDEEKRFLATLDQGTSVLGHELDKLKDGGTLGGEIMFKLYDTFGFPADLTRLMAEERGFHVDELGFEKHLKASKEKAKASWKGKALSSDAAHLVAFSQNKPETKFTGYETTQETDAKLLALSDGAKETGKLSEGATGVVVVDKTCFYAEGGGQVGDRGIVRSASGEAEVLETTKQNGVFLHQVKVTDGVLNKGDVVQLAVNDSERRATANNHSATHLMHAALRMVLGHHVQQAGSLVEPERLRFDFTHNQPLTQTEIERIEDLVNAEIAKGVQVKGEVMSHKQALEKGAMALFGEKYGDEVRVIQMGPFSMELCGGTHDSNTAQIRLNKIVSEGGVSSGVRRIEAITGDMAAQYLQSLARESLQARSLAGMNVHWTKYLEPDAAKLTTWIEQAQENQRSLAREVQSLKGKNVNLDEIAGSATSFTSNGIDGRFVFADIPMDDRKVLSDLSDKLQDRLKDAVVVIVGQGEQSHPVIVSVSKSLAGKLNAGKILNEVATTLGGKGGGRPDFAQGAVPSRNSLAQAKDKALSMIRPN